MDKIIFNEGENQIAKPTFMSQDPTTPSTSHTSIQHQPDDVWKIIVENLRMNVSPRDMNIWYKDVYLNKIENGVAELSCDTTIKREWIESNHRNFIKNKISEIIGYKPDLIISIRSAIKREVPQENKYEYYNPASSGGNSQQGSMFEPQVSSARQNENSTSEIQSNLNPKYTLDNFIVGSNNQLAHAVAESITETPGVTYNPVFFYGPSGVGKTHLMQAIGNAMVHRDPTSKILYVPIETFMNEMIEAIRTRKNEEFRKKYRPIDLLIIDDIQFISTYKKTQEELFNTFNTLYQANKQIVIASDRPPKEIENLPDRLRTRFEGGMVIDMQAPDYETRIAIIRQKVGDLGIIIPDQFISFIAQNVESSVRELEGAVTKVATQMKFSPTPLDEETIAKMLQVDIDTKRRRIKPEDILSSVCEVYGTTTKDIKGKRRTAYVAMTRQVTMYLMRDILELPLEQIAKHVNRKDHTTVIHACSRIEEMLEKDPRFKEKIDKCRNILAK